MRRRRIKNVVGTGLALTLLLATSAVALADSVGISGVDVAEVSGSKVLGLGDVCAGVATSSDTGAVIVQLVSNPSSTQFTDGGTVTITASGPPGLTASGGSFTVPTGFAASAQGTKSSSLSPFDAEVASTVTLTTSTLGAYSQTLSYTATEGALTKSGDLTVTANVLASTSTACTTTPTTVAPTVTPVISGGTAGTTPWYIGGTVSLSWTITGTPTPTVDVGADCGPHSISSDGVYSYTCAVTNSAGSASATATIKYDSTSPTLSGAPTTSPNSNGWYKTNVTIHWTCGDNLSGVVSCPADDVISSEGSGLTASESITDNAGNSSGTIASSPAVNIDKTAPTVNLVGGPTDGSSYYFGFVPSAPTCNASDNSGGSGLDGTCSVSGYDTTVGSHTVTATATDLAGNTGTDVHSYTVLAWTLNGFFQPVDMPGTANVVNTVKNGSTVPFKFRIFAGTTELTDTADVKSLTYKAVACSSSPTDDIEQTATGGSSLRYDTTAQQFVYNWQTPKTPGACLQATMTTMDGSSLSALFKLK